MLKDYYRILGVPPTASDAEIKSAYRSMSMWWHPDKNPNEDVTTRMQDINEAYYILKDSIRRQRYDAEYRAFEQSRKQQTVTFYTQSDGNSSSASDYYYNYTVHDEDLKNDIDTARQKAKEMVEQFLSSLKTASKDAAKGAWSEMYPYIISAIIFSIIIYLIHVCL